MHRILYLPGWFPAAFPSLFSHISFSREAVLLRAMLSLKKGLGSQSLGLIEESLYMPALKP